MDIGDRMKAYEKAADWHLPPKSWVVIRVDGRAFHTFTRNCQKPFDDRLMESMRRATQETAVEMSGIRLAYTQSDEASFAISTAETPEGEDWMGYSYSKIVSVVASAFTVHFNADYRQGKAQFDCRAFSIPEVEVGNYFVWRQKDWERNSLMMLARSHFSHKALLHQKREDMHELLHGIGVHWGDLAPVYKTGTFFVGRDSTPHCEKWRYDEITSRVQKQVDSPELEGGSEITV